MLLRLDQIEESEGRYLAADGVHGRTDPLAANEKAAAHDVDPDIIKGNLIGEAENLRKREAMLAEEAKEPLDFAFERAIGRNDSVYSNFVELLSDVKRKVGRISCKIGTRQVGCATGFMVSEQLMLTNWHVFKTKEEVAQSEIQFFYELDRNGNHPASYPCFRLRADIFYHSNKSLDYCFIAVEPVDISGKMSLSDIGYVFLDTGLGKLGSEKVEALNIIHHPDGDFKQLSIRENIFKKITSTAIWYESDTAPGSSGSPVFNDQWQVVALHHMGVAKKNENGQYIDKDGDIIPINNGKVDESKVVWVANEGIRISVIVKDVFSVYPDNKVLNTLKAKPSTAKSPAQEGAKQDTAPHSVNKTDNDNSMESNNVKISFPATLVEKNGTINIHINQGEGGPVSVAKQKQESDDEAMLLEIKKLEESLDFSQCKGYQSRFLGVDIPMPKPKTRLRKFIAKVDGTDSMVLKYYHYSVLLHTVRMMPTLSAINVDGDMKKRQDDTERKDVWLRDTRIDFDIQLNDQYYKRSGFDRGHMSRREDANWGSTPEDAKRNADLTCMYTNACPQVAAINQSKKKGLWGRFELTILEQGATREKAKARKISVFNGPIFLNTDPVYKGIQVPLHFFKIVVWLTDDGQPRATAFRLSQEDLVGDIDFEQLDLDQIEEFQEYQCSIKWLEEQTDIDFSDLIPLDTFSGDHEAGEEIVNETELREILTRSNNK